MTRVEYIRQLEFSLGGKLPRGEISDILRDYSEYFEAGKAEGKTEEEIAAKLGIPYAVAEQILSENEEKPEPPGKKKWFAGGKKEKEEREEAREGERRPRWTAAAGAFAPGRLWARIRAWLCRANKAIAALFDRRGPSPSPAGSAPAKPRRERSLLRGLLGTLLFLLLLPVIAFALFFGGAALFFAAAALVGVAALLFTGFLASLALLFLGACALTLAGSLLPESAVLLLVFGLIACLGAGVVSLCLCVWTFRGLGRLIRYCFGRGKYLRSARNPAYQAQQNAAPPPASGPAPSGDTPEDPARVPPEADSAPDGVFSEPLAEDSAGRPGGFPDVPEKEENGNA